MNKTLLILAILATAVCTTACSGNKPAADSTGAPATAAVAAPATKSTLLPVMLTYNKDAFSPEKIQAIVKQAAMARGWVVAEAKLGETNLAYKGRFSTVTYDNGIISISVQDKKARVWADNLARDINKALMAAS